MYVSDELLQRLDVPGPRYTSYPTVPEWDEAFGEAAYLRALAAASRAPDQPLSLYVHIPFCKEMCTYCGCNVVVTKDPRKVDRYLDAVRQELRLVSGHLGERRTVTRLHLGGGTPTFLDEAQLTRLWEDLSGTFRIAPDAEIALEIDPVVTRREQLALLRRLGWNRISMGVQDLDPDVQRAVNRIQSLEETANAVAYVRELGFRSVSLDLIYGLPRQTLASWRRTLEQIVAIRPDRVAAFSFAYVPTARPNQRRLPIAELPSGKDKLDLYWLTQETFAAAGYRPIGMDHFALDHDELARAEARGELWRDFQGYTTLKATDTIAFGVSGIGDVGGAFVQTGRSLLKYEEALAQDRLPVARGHVLSVDDQRRRALITLLMCNLAVDLGAARADGLDLSWEREALRPLEADGVVRLDGDTLRVTPLGRLFLRNVAMVFDTYLRRQPAHAAPRFSRTV